MANVLSIGYLEKFLSQRQRVLSSGGHQVTSARSIKNALKCLQGSRFQVVVFGHGVPADDRNFIARHIKQSMPQVRVIFLYDQRIDQTELADAVLSIRGEPSDLLRTVDYLCGGRAFKADGGAA